MNLGDVIFSNFGDKTVKRPLGAPSVCVLGGFVTCSAASEFTTCRLS